MKFFIAGADLWSYFTQMAGQNLVCGNVHPEYHPDWAANYPPWQLLFQAFPANDAYLLFVVLHVIIAFIASVLFVKTYTNEKILQFAAAAVYAFGGATVALLYWGPPAYLVGHAWLPAILLGMVKVVGKGKDGIVFGLAGGAATGLTVMSGNWYYAFYLAVIYAVIVGHRVYSKRAEPAAGIFLSEARGAALLAAGFL